MENPHRGLFLAVLALVAAASLAFASQRRWRGAGRAVGGGGDKEAPAAPSDEGAADRDREEEVVRVAFVGNSILYYNDTPRFLAYLRNAAAAASAGGVIGGGGPSMVQDSCLRGGASLVSILADGNGMRNKFGTADALRPDGTYDIGAPTVKALLLGADGEAKWDFVVMNDYTQAPVREENRLASLNALVNEYVPLLLSSGARPVFLVTAAYREPVKNSEDLGGVESFTSKLVEGYEEYAAAVGKLLPEAQRPVVAPVGLAFLRVYREDRDLWRKLFDTDDFHPSPHGSFLQACVLHWSVFGKALPAWEMAASPPPSEGSCVEGGEGDDDGPAVLWDWAKARVMQPEGTPPLPLPSAREAEYLREVAGRVWWDYNSARRRTS